MSKIRLTWNYPTKRVAGGDLLGTDIAGVEITGSVTAKVDYPLREYLTGELPFGTHAFSAVCVLKDGQRSSPVSASATITDTSPPEVLLNLSAVVESV